MAAESAIHIRRYVQRAVIASGMAVLVAGGLVLLGWGTGSPVLRTLGPWAISMIPNTATGFMAGGAAVVLHVAFAGSAAARWIRLALSLYVLLLGGLTMLERLFDYDFGIDLLLFAEAVKAAPWRPSGRMALNSTVCFTLLGSALLLLDVGRSTRRAAQFLAIAAFLVAFLALLGYAYGVDPLYTVGQFSGGMALPTAANFALLSLGILFARSDSGLASLFTNDRASGVFSRRLAPAVVLVPVSLGWLLLTAREENWMPERVGVAMFAATVFGVFLILLVRSARAVERLDRDREALLEDARRARADAEAANLAKTQFLTSMSHELRTPLNAIAGYVQLIDLGIHGPVSDAQREALERTRRSQQHLLSLINDVLNFAKLDAGRVEFYMREVPLHDALHTIEAMVLPQIASKSLHFAIRCDDLDTAVMADREKLQQVLLNLLSNAIKFTPVGGRITLDCEPSGSILRIAVHDTGNGIAAEALDTIFEPFVQVDRSLTNITEGAGLGLAISRELARGMGGELVAESVRGEGSTFTLTLNRAPGPGGAARPDTDQSPALAG